MARSHSFYKFFFSVYIHTHSFITSIEFRSSSSSLSAQVEGLHWDASRYSTLLPYSSHNIASSKTKPAFCPPQKVPLVGPGCIGIGANFNGDKAPLPSRSPPLAGASFKPRQSFPFSPVAPLVWPLSAQELALTQTKLLSLLGVPPSGEAPRS